MFFLDSSGFFSLVGLLVQCALAWTLAVLFAVVLRPGLGPLGFRDWFWAFLSLAVALLAMSLRFVFAYQHVTRSVELVNENAPLTRGLYLIYQLGKAAFIGFLATGVARLRGLRLPAGTPALALGVGVYAALGALLARDVEWMLLLQAPIMIGGSLLARQWLLPFHRERRDVGSWVVLQALPVCATLWGLYAVAVVALDLVTDPKHSLWNLPLQFNSYCDLIGQVVVGVGLIVIVLQESQHQTELAHQERDQLREQLARDEKLRALGTLVSGVAHELNNPLTSILGFSDYLLAQDPALRANAARIVREQSERCLGIVRSLSALAGRNPVRREPLVVAEWIDRVVRGFQPQLDAAGVTLEVRCATDLPLVQGDRVGLEQVLANLVANALHASPRGGSIVVRAVHADGRVEVAVLDSGAGIAPEVRSRLFEPFFTTKAPGDGTGLGLALARALVRSHRGELLLAESRPGSGAEFVVQLPIADLHLTVSRETPSIAAMSISLNPSSRP